MIILYNTATAASVSADPEGNYTLTIHGDADGLGITTTLTPAAMLALGASIEAVIQARADRTARRFPAIAEAARHAG